LKSEALTLHLPIFQFKQITQNLPPIPSQPLFKNIPPNPIVIDSPNDCNVEQFNPAIILPVLVESLASQHPSDSDSQVNLISSIPTQIQSLSLPRPINNPNSPINISLTDSDSLDLPSKVKKKNILTRIHD